MNKELLKQRQRSMLRKRRVRSRIHGTSKRPRLCLRFSNQYAYAQVINDDEHTTLLQVSVGDMDEKGSMIEKASLLGSRVSELSLQKKIKAVSLDRGDKKYHGRVEAFANAARKGGLEF